MTRTIWDRVVLSPGVESANRLVVAPMTTYASQLDGRLADDEAPYLARRAAGGFGTVMTAACYVHPSGHAFHGQWACSDDAFLPSLRKARDAIHCAGSLAVLQIHHGGRQCPPELCGGRALSASAIPAERPGAAVPVAMTASEIEGIIEAFGSATRRAAEAGYDAVEIHGANTYLLQQFVSPHSNRRTDAWGADRLRFPMAVTDAVLNAGAGRLAVGYRFSPEEPTEPGLRLTDTFALVDALCARKLAFLHVSLRDWNQPIQYDPDGEPVLAQLARRIDGRTLLIGVGGVRTLADAEGALDLGADMVAIGRCAITEPEWPKCVAEGRTARTKVPATDAASILTLPKGLADKIANTPGWFEIEDIQPTA